MVYGVVGVGSKQAVANVIRTLSAYKLDGGGWVAKKKLAKPVLLVVQFNGGGAQARARAGNVSDLKSWAASAVYFCGMIVVT